MSALIPLAVWFALTAFLTRFVDRRLWRSLPSSLRLYLVLGWSLVSIGIAQSLLTPLKFESFDEGALWFATSGSAVALTGALNLLNLRGGLGEAGVRRVSTMANVWITLVFVAVATHRGAEPPHDPVSMVLIAVGVAATGLSIGFHRPVPGR